MSGPEKRLIPAMGGAVASRRLIDQGLPVGWMEREPPRDPRDSGWFITSGQETEAELSDASAFAVYDLDTLVRRDPEIVRFLTRPPGTVVGRVGPDRQLVVVQGPPPPPVEMLTALQAGPARLTEHWRCVLPAACFRRLDDGSLVLWRPELTLWIDARSTTEPVDARLQRARSERSPAATQVDEQRAGDQAALRYRLVEGTQPRWIARLFAPGQELLVSASFDTPTAEAQARVVLWSLASTRA
ncbi:MAG: DUF2185 domain-containing protein [Alphaproteobacteria bacterium]|nr:DUF2185 domain-containing protein [Alphaproteobacteria bacterium]